MGAPGEGRRCLWRYSLSDRGPHGATHPGRVDESPEGPQSHVALESLIVP